jgi:hypothetical protein
MDRTCRIQVEIRGAYTILGQEFEGKRSLGTLRIGGTIF